MKENPSVPELQLLLERIPCAHPEMSQEARRLLGQSVGVIDRVGVPIQQGDWFQACNAIEPCHKVDGTCYTIDDNVRHITNALQLGRSDFGVIIVDGNTGHLVYVDEDGDAQLINTSLERFLHFVGRVQQSADSGWTDIADLRLELVETDPAPLRNPEGVWSLTLEEAEAGLY